MNAELGSDFRFFREASWAQEEIFFPSLSFQFEYHYSWNDGKDLFDFVPYFRYDYEDSDRNLIDIRELSWIHVGNSWEFRAGVRKIFWGVAESSHLVDIVNQVDFLEGLDGEEKLGQMMFNLSLTREWGILDFFVLPGFRERNFSGANGRPSYFGLIDGNLAEFESGARNHRADFAFRWSHYIGDFDIALSHFSGTSREPRLMLRKNFDENVGTRQQRLFPFYDVIDQTGIDAQYIIGDWAWKLEAITRSGQGERFWSSVFGFEKTFVGVLDSRSDIGILMEYLYDSRGTNSPNLFEDDLAIGVRYSLNNPQDLTALVLAVYDVETREYFLNLEASTRLGSKWKLVLEVSIFRPSERNGIFDQDQFPWYMGNPSDSELFLFEDEDFVRLQFMRYL